MPVSSVDTILVVPCYNEEQRLPRAEFANFANNTPRVRVLFVNDGSRDRTAEVLDRLVAEHPARMQVCHLAANAGKAEAVRQGTLIALGEKPAHVGFWDADLATPLEAVADFLRVLDRLPQLHSVIGVRLGLLGRSIQRRKLRMRLGQVFAVAASRVLGASCCDTQCGAKMFRATPEVEAAFSRPFHSRWIFDVEVLARLRCGFGGSPRLDLRETVYELPLDAWQEVKGSKLKSGDFLKAVLELADIYWNTVLFPERAPQVPSVDSPVAIDHKKSQDPQVRESVRRAA